MEVVPDSCQTSVGQQQPGMDWSSESQAVLSWVHSQTNAYTQTRLGTTCSREQIWVDHVGPTIGPWPEILGWRSESASKYHMV